MNTVPEQQATDAFEELAAATKAVAIARRKLAIADDRLRNAMVNYIGGNAGEGRASPEKENAHVRGRIIDRVAAVVRAGGGANVTAGDIIRSTGSGRCTIGALCSKLVRDPASGIVRVKNGVFAYTPDNAAREARTPGASKTGRPASEIMGRIDATIDAVLKHGDRLPTSQIVAAVLAALDHSAKAITIINRLYKRARYKPPTLLAHYEPIGRVYSLPVSSDAGEGVAK